jgi:hypothetical protein
MRGNDQTPKLGRLPPLIHKLIQYETFYSAEFVTREVSIRQKRSLEQRPPSFNHLIGVPILSLIPIHIRHQMIVIGHQGISGTINGKALGKHYEPIEYPLATIS